tara:strand:- start:4395 stop:6524 length:2130 start_codon:yes stop_codon:yes gene_type:complete
MTDSNFIIKKGLDVFDGDVSLKGSNKELRFYEGANYVGFEAPALSADKIWVLPNADGSTGQALKTDGSGNLGWVSVGGIASLAADDTPQLGGDLDVNGNSIVSTSNTAINITPNGTGDIQLNADTIRVGDSNADVTIAPNISSTTAKLQFQSDGDTLLRTASGTGNMYLNANSLMSMQATTFRFGTSGGNPTLTTLGTSDLTLNTNSGTNSGSIVIADGANSDISITPNGTGQVNLGNFQFDVDQTVGSGQDNYVLTYDHANTQISLEAAGGGGGASAIDDLSDAITTASSNIGLGSGALDSLTASSGNWNTAVGINAGTSVTTGDANVFMGLNAGQYITTGGGNIGIGKGALERGTTEYNNLAIGPQALQGAYGQSTTGAYNVAIGSDTLRYGAQGNGSNNIGIGNKALYGSNGNSSGANNNIGIGNESLEAITTGDYNIGLGYKSLEANTTGLRNIAIGTQALDAADTESDNIAIGYDALGGSVAGGQKNVAIGNYSLDALTSASYNIAIGHEAGNITTGSNNVVIGAADVTATGNDQLSISSGDGGVTWITGDSDGNVKGTDFYIVAEWNDQYFTDSLRNGKRFSFGAGMNNNTNSDSGTIGTETILPKACTLEEMHFWIGNVGAETGSGNFTVRIDKNGTELTTGYTFNMSGSGGNHVQKSFTPNVSFDAGETFNLTLHDAATSGYASQNQIGRVRVTFRFRTNN